jgi:hypothetical protein
VSKVHGHVVFTSTLANTHAKTLAKTHAKAPSFALDSLF